MTRTLALLTLLVVLCAIPGTEAFAATAKNAKTPKAVIADPIKDATVNLYCRLKAGKTIFTPSGSGVFINDRGVILTNAHVAQYFLLAAEKGRVTGWCSVRTGSPAEEMYTAEILYIPPAWLTDNITKISEDKPKGTGENDFALLRVVAGEKGAALPAKFPALPVGTLDGIIAGTDVTIAGYPIGSLDFSGARNKLNVLVTTGELLDTRGFDRVSTDILSLAPETAAGAGVSGGLIANSAKQVVGIVTSRSSGKKPTLRGITIPYVDRMVKTQTGLSLSSIITGDLAARAAITKLFIPADTILTLANGLRSKAK